MLFVTYKNLISTTANLKDKAPYINFPLKYILRCLFTIYVFSFFIGLLFSGIFVSIAIVLFILMIYYIFLFYRLWDIYNLSKAKLTFWLIGSCLIMICLGIVSITLIKLLF